jgi:hypothetical protein
MIRGLVYFAVVFSAGFLLGPIRVLWLVPHVGERMAELLEAPVMLAVIVLAARWLVARFPAKKRAAFLASGLLALLLVVLAEIAVVLTLRGQTIRDYISDRDPVSGIVYVCLLIAFAAMPWALARTGRTEAAA